MAYDALRAQYAKNAVQLAEMIRVSKSKGPGKKYRGFVLEELERHYERISHMSKATDEELAETFAKLQRAFGKSLKAIAQQVNT